MAELSERLFLLLVVFALTVGASPTAFTSIITGSILGNFKTADKAYCTISQIPSLVTATAIFKGSTVMGIVFQRRHAAYNHFQLTAT